MNDLRRALKPWDADVRRRRALSFVEATIVAVLPLSAILTRWSTGWGLALAAVWIAAVLLAVAWPTIPARVARHADRVAGLKAVCDTALHLRATGHPAADAVALDALDALSRASGPTPPRLARPKALALAALVAVVLFVVPKPHRASPEAERTPPDRVASDLTTLEEAARDRGDLALAEAARKLRSDLLSADAVLDVPPAPAPRESAAPPPRDELAPEPDAATATQALFPPMPKADQAVSKWESDPVGKELASELHEALDKYMSLDKMKNKAIAKAKIQGGSAPFDDGALADPGRSADAGTTGLGAGAQNLPPNARDQAGAAQLALDNLRNTAKEQAKRSAMAQHENAVAMQHAYDEFLKQYAQTLRDRVMETLEKFEKAQQKSNDDGPSLGPGGSERGEGEPSSGSGDLSDAAQMQELQDAPSTLAKVDGPPDSLESGGGGTGETSPGGAGAGQGQEGTPVSATPEPASGSGDPDRVRGQFRPGSLSPSEQEDLFDALEARAAVQGPFAQFGPEVRPYVSEAQEALEHEPVDPRMKSWVESYLRHLAG
jgi:hypothetical protein